MFVAGPCVLANQSVALAMSSEFFNGILKICTDSMKLITHQLVQGFDEP
jgi:hypothetical protein